MFKTYYKLTKPGIIYGNAINALAGFFLATQGRYDFKLLLMMLIGISLIVASACVFNNIWDAGIDSKMERTKHRSMVTGSIKKPNAIIFGIVLLILGVIVLALSANPLALYSGLLGFITYVFLYTPLKHATIYATQIGAVAGAMPAVVGYAAVTNNLDVGAGILFLIIALWQMPHFYAIAIYRMDEYAAAGVPVLSVKKGIEFTKINMLIYMVGFIIAISMLTVYTYTGILYLLAMLALSLIWLWKGIKGFKKNTDNKHWARKIFSFSLIVILAFCIAIPLDKLFG